MTALVAIVPYSVVASVGSLCPHDYVVDHADLARREAAARKKAQEAIGAALAVGAERATTLARQQLLGIKQTAYTPKDSHGESPTS